MARAWSPQARRWILAAPAVIAVMSLPAAWATWRTPWCALEAQIAEEEGRLRQAAATVARRGMVDAACAAYPAVIRPSASAEEAMLALLDDVHAAAAPLLVTQVQPHPAQQEAGRIRQAVELHATGSLEQLTAFLMTLRRQAPAAKVTWMQITAEPSAILRLRFLIETLQFVEAHH